MATARVSPTARLPWTLPYASVLVLAARLMYLEPTPRVCLRPQTQRLPPAPLLSFPTHPGGQRANAGMLPPSDSEEEEGEEGAEPKPKKEADASTSAAAAGGQSKNAGKMPASDSEEEDDDDDDSDDDDDPTPEYLRAAPTARKKWVRVGEPCGASGG